MGSLVLAVQILSSFFQSGSELFTGSKKKKKIWEFSQVLHCSLWAVRGTGEHRQRSGKNRDGHGTVSHSGLLFSSNCRLPQILV